MWARLSLSVSASSTSMGQSPSWRCLEALVPGVLAQLNSAEPEQCPGLCAQSSVTKGHTIEAVEEHFS